MYDRDWPVLAKVQRLHEGAKSLLEPDDVTELWEILNRMGQENTEALLHSSRQQARVFLETSDAKRRSLLRTLPHQQRLLTCYSAVAWSARAELLLERLLGSAILEPQAARWAVGGTLWLVSEYECSNYWMWPWPLGLSPFRPPFPDNDEDEASDD